MTAPELVKALRERANLLDEPHYSPLMRDAADRLERVWLDSEGTKNSNPDDEYCHGAVDQAKRTLHLLCQAVQP